MMFRSWITAGALLVTMIPPAAAEDRASPLPPEAERALDHLVSLTVSEAHLPSLSLAVARSGELAYATAVGHAALENALAATPESVYPIGSVTKALTAVAALQLAERGLLDLDAPVTQYCEGFAAKEYPVTTRQLLGHLGGIRGYDYSRFEEDFLNHRVYRSLAAALEKFGADPLIAAPGTTYEYSSYGYVLVGCAIEGAGGVSYGEYLRENVLEPAGANRIGLDDPEAIIPFRVRGYARGQAGDWKPAGCFNPSDRYPAGGLVATAGDLVRFGAFLLEGELLSTSSRQAMWQIQRTAAGEPTGSALGWSSSDDGSEIFHGGTTVGGTAYLYLRPADRVVVAFTTNLSLWTEGRQELARKVADLVAGPR